VGEREFMLWVASVVVRLAFAAGAILVLKDGWRTLDGDGKCIVVLFLVFAALFAAGGAALVGGAHLPVPTASAASSD
jgi:hypothetical protein